MALDHSSDIAGMTTNERLSHFRLLEQFDAAAKARDRERMVTVLARAMVDDPEQVTDLILRSPAIYGF